MKIEQLYNAIRPALQRSGVIPLARRILNPNTRAGIARRVGLAHYISPLPPRARYAGKITADGVNYIADMRADIGIGESTRGIYTALRAAGIPVNYQEIATPLISRTHGIPHTQTTDALYGVTIAHTNPPEMQLGVQAYPDSFKDRYAIGYWLWEVSQFPKRWIGRIAAVDEIWTASHYSQAILQTVTDIPVIYIPIPVTPETSGKTRAEFGLPEDRFIFFYAFNPGSSVARKNPYGIIEAYQRAFAGTDNPPLLVIKAHHLTHPANTKIAPKLRAAVAEVGGVLIEDHLTRTAMNDLLAASDCLVSLHRAEGFGLIMAEAMALSKPVIATGYSANMDFMTAENSYPVNYTLRAVTAEDHRDQPELAEVYQPGQLWAEPDFDHAADLMRAVFANREAAVARGVLAQQDIARLLSPQAVGAQVAARLRELEALRA